MSNTDWRLDAIWNDSLKAQQRELKERQHINAGEIGKNHYERYLKMRAVPPSNPLEDRVLRKFSAGIWFEEQIGYVLKMVGILKSSQETIRLEETPDTLAITGRLDFHAGGLSDWNEARARVQAANFPDFIRDVSLKLIEQFEKNYPQGLSDVIYEVKSVNSQVFWAKKDYLEEAYPHHVMQLYTYLKAKNLPEGRVFYISKDDLTVKEIVVKYPDVKLEEKWLLDVVAMTNFIRGNIEPPKPESVIFDKRSKLRFQYKKQKYVIEGCYTDNWEIKWSAYFSLITGCKTEDEWWAKIQPTVKDKNDELKAEFISKLIT